MSNLAKTVFRFVGISSIILAGVGVITNSLTFSFGASRIEPDAPYFNIAYIIMSLICITCYLLLFFFGVKFIRLQAQVYPYFVGLLVFEVIYVFSIWIVVSPFSDSVQFSVARATGITNGGLMVQFVTLFILWAPILIRAAKREVAKQ